MRPVAFLIALLLAAPVISAPPRELAAVVATQDAPAPSQDKASKKERKRAKRHERDEATRHQRKQDAAVWGRILGLLAATAIHPLLGLAVLIAMWAQIEC